MASAIVSAFHDQGPRGSMERATSALSNAQTLMFLNNALTACGATTATTAAKAKTVNTLTFQIAGAFYSLAGTDNYWTFGGTTSPTTVAKASWQKYLLCVNNSGTASVYEGTQSTVNAAGVSWGNIATGSWGPVITVLNTGVCIASVVTIATDATHTFIPGTTALNATGITATFADGFDASLIPIIGNESSLIVGTAV